jgi:hypothetical protein
VRSPIERITAMEKDVVDPDAIGLEGAKHDTSSPPGDAANPAARKEEEAKQDAKLRPEREAGFGDYIVCSSGPDKARGLERTNKGSRESSSMARSGITYLW